MARFQCSDQVHGDVYEFRVCGELGSDWSEWFDRFEVVARDNETVIRGPVRDQAALYGMIAKLHYLGLALLAVHRLRQQSEHAGAGEELRPAAHLQLAEQVVDVRLDRPNANVELGGNFSIRQAARNQRKDFLLAFS